jgi:transcriptional regulator with XRE-family HTH domain
MKPAEIKAARLRLGLTQQELADALNKTAQELGWKTTSYDRIRVSKFEKELTSERPFGLSQTISDLFVKTFERLDRERSNPS